MIDNLIRDLEITKKHYFLSGVFIAIIATMSMFLVIFMAEFILKEIGVLIKINPLLTIIAYIVAFTLPHVIFKIKENISIIIM